MFKRFWHSMLNSLFSICVSSGVPKPWNPPTWIWHLALSTHPLYHTQTIRSSKTWTPERSTITCGGMWNTKAINGRFRTSNN
jgi:hypothetical protein